MSQHNFSPLVLSANARLPDCASAYIKRGKLPKRVLRGSLNASVLPSKVIVLSKVRFFASCTSVWAERV